MEALEKIEAEISQTKEALENVQGSPTEVYARIVGYYRSVRNWNRGKREEFTDRSLFSNKLELVPETAQAVTA